MKTRFLALLCLPTLLVFGCPANDQDFPLFSSLRGAGEFVKITFDTAGNGGIQKPNISGENFPATPIVHEVARRKEMNSEMERINPFISQN
jgi:hypothetical protein